MSRESAFVATLIGQRQKVVNVEKHRNADA
jgi:hypothetical protein